MNKQTPQALAAALERGKQEAQRRAGQPDGGTCNFDAPALDYRAAGLTKRQAIAVIEAAGLTCFDWRPFRGPAMLVIGGFASGQANRRTLMAEAFWISLQGDGFTACMYYQMD